MSSSLDCPPVVVSDFLQETELMELLRGAGGASIPLDLGSTLPALLMTFCGTENPFNYLNSSESEPSLLFTMTLGLRVTKCLQELHSKNIVHCDLRPDNVALKFDPKRKLESVHLIDFGYACHVGHQYHDKVRYSTFDWYCDCLFTGAPISVKCDLPGLGIIFDDTC